jgi:hypothetical protein
MLGRWAPSYGRESTTTRAGMCNHGAPWPLAIAAPRRFELVLNSYRWKAANGCINMRRTTGCISETAGAGRWFTYVQHTLSTHELPTVGIRQFEQRGWYLQGSIDTYRGLCRRSFAADGAL